MSNLGVYIESSTMRSMASKRLSELCQIKYGKDHKLLGDGDIPVYGSGGVMRYANKYLYAKKSVLIPRKGTLKNLMYVDTPFWSVDTMFYTEIDESKVMPEYLYYSLQLVDLVGMNVGTAVPSLTTALLNEIVLSIPKLSIQKNVVNFISAIDKKIEVNKRIIENLEEQARAIFKSWFVDFEPFQGGEFIESELGMIPAGWSVSLLEDVAKIIAGGDKPATFSSEQTIDCSIPVYSNGITSFGLFGYTSTPKISAESVTVSARGTIGFVCLRQVPFFPIVRLLSAIPDDDLVSAKYLYLFLRNANISGEGTTQQQLTAPTFKKYQIVLPPIEDVRRFNRVVDPCFEKIFLLRNESDVLAQLRDTLLPKLMSGEIEVPCDE